MARQRLGGAPIQAGSAWNPDGTIKDVWARWFNGIAAKLDSIGDSPLFLSGARGPVQSQVVFENILSISVQPQDRGGDQTAIPAIRTRHQPDQILVCTQATFPTLATVQPNTFIFVSDFFHLIFFDGTTPVFADGGSNYYVYADRVPAGGGWVSVSGNTVNYLNADGTTTAKTLPNSTGSVAFLSFGGAGDGSFSAAVAPGVTGTCSVSGSVSVTSLSVTVSGTTGTGTTGTGTTGSGSTGTGTTGTGTTGGGTTSTGSTGTGTTGAGTTGTETTGGGTTGTGATGASSTGGGTTTASSTSASTTDPAVLHIAGTVSLSGSPSISGSASVSGSVASATTGIGVSVNSATTGITGSFVGSSFGTEFLTGVSITGEPCSSCSLTESSAFAITSAGGTVTLSDPGHSHGTSLSDSGHTHGWSGSVDASGLSVGIGSLAASQFLSVTPAIHSHGIPALTIPSLTCSSQSIPSLFMSGLTVPGLSIPGLSVPGLSIPGLSIPGLTVPGLSIPGLSIPSLSVAGLGIPGLSIPSLTVSGTGSGTGSGTFSGSGTITAAADTTGKPRGWNMRAWFRL